MKRVWFETYGRAVLSGARDILPCAGYGYTGLVPDDYPLPAYRGVYA